MGSPEEQLDQEALLTLYLAGELDAVERQKFEQRLASDGRLVAEVEKLRRAQDGISATLARADANTRLPASEGVVVRRVSRAINHWLANRLGEPVPATKKGWPMPWWSYPMGMAACLMIGFIVWSSRQEVGPMESSPEVKRELSMIEAEQAELAEWLSNSLDATADASMDAEIEQILAADGLEDVSSIYLMPREERSQ